MEEKYEQGYIYNFMHQVKVAQFLQRTFSRTKPVVPLFVVIPDSPFQVLDDDDGTTWKRICSEDARAQA